MFQKGYTPHNKGMKMSAEFCAKLRGRTPWNKGIQSGNHGNGFTKGQTAWNKGKKGLQSAWNKGVPMSEETKKRVSIAKMGCHKGIPRTDEVKRKISIAKDRGLTSLNKLERGRFQRELVPIVLKRDNYTCQFCDQYGGALHIDHIQCWSEYPELRFNLDNCRTLCRPCHYYVTFKRKMPLSSVWGLNNSRERG